MGGRLLALALLACLPLAACTSGSADPTPSSTEVRTTPVNTSTTSPSPTPSNSTRNVRPGELSPTLTPQGHLHDALGARLFAVYFVRAFSWGYSTNSSALVRSLSSPMCKACATYERAIEAAREKHQVLLGGQITIKSITDDSRHFTVSSDRAVRIGFSEIATTLVSPSGARKLVAPAEPAGHITVLVNWVDSKWQTRELSNK